MRRGRNDKKQRGKHVTYDDATNEKLKAQERQRENDAYENVINSDDEEEEEEDDVMPLETEQMRRHQRRATYLENKLKQQIQDSITLTDEAAAEVADGTASAEQTSFASSLRRSRRRATLLASQLKSLIEEEEAFGSEKFDQDDFEAELHIPGAGVYVFWQLGVMDFLRDRYDLTKIHISGASAGAFSAVFAMARVDINEFVEYMSLLVTIKYKVYDRRLGLMGVITDIFRDCLEKFLPESSHQLVNNVTILVTDASSHKVEQVTGFSGRESVQNAVLASMHIPFLNNGKYASQFRDKKYYDGALLAKPKDYEKRPGRPNVVIDRNEDEYFADKTIWDCVKHVSVEEGLELMEAGRKFAKRLEDEGRLQCFPKNPDFGYEEGLLEGNTKHKRCVIQ